MQIREIVEAFKGDGRGGGVRGVADVVPETDVRP